MIHNEWRDPQYADDVSIGADDGTRWVYAPLPEGEWTGFEPGEEGVWIRTQAEMERNYPEVIAYWRSDGGLHRAR